LTALASEIPRTIHCKIGRQNCATTGSSRAPLLLYPVYYYTVEKVIKKSRNPCGLAG